MARLSLIGLLAFFAIACFGIGFGLYRCGKRIMVNGKPVSYTHLVGGAGSRSGVGYEQNHQYQESLAG